MNNPYFISFELVQFALFFLCLRHARRVGVTAVWQLLVGIAFGVSLEIVTLIQASSYRYGQFTLMFVGVPLAIGLAWGNFIYAARTFSKHTTLPRWARPILVALLVVNIDLLMDPIAIRLRMWDWGFTLWDQFFPIPYDVFYFGVPHGNFWGWFWVVFSFSAGIQALENHRGCIGQWFPPLGALLLGLLTLLAANEFMRQWVPVAITPIVVWGLLLVALTLLVVLHPRLTGSPPPLLAQITLITQGYFIVAGVISGVVFDPPALLIAILFLFAGSLFGFYRIGLRKFGINISR